MKILLLGDYSNVHATLAAGLRALGHEVTLASDGDGWKGYARDIDLKRYGMNWRSTMAFLGDCGAPFVVSKATRRPTHQSRVPAFAR